MKVSDLFSTQRGGKIGFHLIKRRKNNPKYSKTTKLNNFVDRSGGMVGYSSKNFTNVDRGYPK